MVATMRFKGSVFKSIDPKIVVGLVGARCLRETFINPGIKAMREKRPMVLTKSEQNLVSAAIVKYQKKRGIKPTGKLDPETLKGLKTIVIDIPKPLIVKVRAPITLTQKKRMISNALDTHNYKLRLKSCSGTVCVFNISVLATEGKGAEKKQYTITGYFTIENSKFDTAVWKNSSDRLKKSVLRQAIAEKKFVRMNIVNNLALHNDFRFQTN